MKMQNLHENRGFSAAVLKLKTNPTEKFQTVYQYRAQHILLLVSKETYISIKNNGMRFL